MVKTIVDQIGRSVSLRGVPKRIVSLVPSQTELLCSFGLENHIVGVTKFCVHPNSIRRKAMVIGGTKQIHLEKIELLKPDIILCNKEENTKSIVEACEGIYPVHVSDIFTIEDSLELIEQYGRLFQKVNEADVLIRSINEKAKEFASFIKNKKTLKTVYFIWKAPWMVAAKETFIDSLLKLNKFKNAYDEELRYPEIKLITREDVDLVLLSSEPFPFKTSHKAELKHIYPNAKIHLVDGEFFSWHGSRLLLAFNYFERLRSNL